MQYLWLTANPAKELATTDAVARKLEASSFPVSAAWKQTVQWMAAPGKPRPPLATIRQGMNDYLNAITHAQLNPGVISVLLGGSAG